MPADTVYLLRHGDSRQDDVRRFIGRSDQPLNAAGRAEAAYWQHELAAIPFQGLFCSDLWRSVETAGIIARGIGTPVQRLPELREIDLGSWDGMPMDEIRRRYPEEYAQRGADLAGHAPPEGESFNDLARRVLPLFHELVLGSSGTILIVGHAGVNRVILSHLLNIARNDIFQIPQDYGCLNIIDCSANGMVPRRINLLPER